VQTVPSDEPPATDAPKVPPTIPSVSVERAELLEFSSLAPR
jgi:hypothetical protein